MLAAFANTNPLLVASWALLYVLSGGGIASAVVILLGLRRR
jgi:hypothetical protein